MTDRPPAHEDAGRPLATLSLDLDDLWAYLRAHGEPDWASSPTVLPRAVERLAPVLDDLALTITVFVVGRDLERPAGRAAVAELADAGHELGNHSWLHRGDLATLDAGSIADDLDRTADALLQVTGHVPAGFRCPSFGMSPTLVEVLIRRGYRYDASVLPTPLGPLVRMYHRATMRADARRDGAPALFGPARNALLPVQPFRWRTPGGELLELPVTTAPLVRVPMHMSYLQALAGNSRGVARAYAGACLALNRRRGVTTSFLLHPPDVLDVDDAPRLSYVPGMSQPWSAKVALLRETLGRLSAGFEVLPMGEAAARLRHRRLPHRAVTGPARTRSAAAERSP